MTSKLCSRRNPCDAISELYSADNSLVWINIFVYVTFSEWWISRYIICYLLSIPNMCIFKQYSSQQNPKRHKYSKTRLFKKICPYHWQMEILLRWCPCQILSLGIEKLGSYVYACGVYQFSLFIVNPAFPDNGQNEGGPVHFCVVKEPKPRVKPVFPAGFT